jgi:hypothetical protein
MGLHHGKWRKAEPGCSVGGRNRAESYMANSGTIDIGNQRDAQSTCVSKQIDQACFGVRRKTSAVNVEDCPDIARFFGAHHQHG